MSQNSNDQFDATATATILKAIAQGNYAENGVVFQPFRLIVKPAAFETIWNSGGGETPITFYSYSGGHGDYRALGDIVTLGSGEPNSHRKAPGGQLLFAPSSRADALRQPTGADRIFDDSGSRNTRDLKAWRLNAPAGYSALGIVFTNGSAPILENYWCVKNEYLINVSPRAFWSDRDQSWRNYNGSLNVPAFGDGVAAPEGKMFLIPPTFLSEQDRGNQQALAMVMDVAELPVPKSEPAAPVYTEETYDQQAMTCGITSVKIVPFTAVAGDQGLDASLLSPFYYVAAQPYWRCTRVMATPAGGSDTFTVKVGTAQTESRSFTNSTSLTVSASVGVSYGGASASVSTSFTRSFSLTTASSNSQDTEVTKTETIALPSQPITSFWQRCTQIAVFRDNLTEVSAVSYGSETHRVLPNPSK